ncbi:MAG: alpha-amylase family glycosyl hydrolase [Bacteroidota bacterium]
MAVDTPNWVKSAIVYEVFPRNHTGNGTFAEIYRDLERIRSLHTDILWLMPIHPVGRAGRKGTLGSPYAIRDYRAIDPDLGDERSLRMLVDKAHALGMKVMLDVVYNHTSRDSVLLREHPEWFLRDASGNFTTKVPDWSDVYDLDYSRQDLWEYQIATLEKWVDLGVDGFRCDVAPLVPLDFWRAARARLAEKKELIWLAESIEKSFVKYLRDQGYTAHSDPELHATFDLTYDYDGFEYLKEYFQGRRPLRDYLNHLHVQETLYPAGAVKLRFLENHDNLRAAEVIRDRDSLANWTAFYALLPGATLVYAGQEIRARNTPTLFEKDTVDWRGHVDPEFTLFMEKVLGFAKEIKSSCSRFSATELAEGVVQLTWLGEGTVYVALLNLANRYGEVRLDEFPEGEICLGERGRSGSYRLESMPVLLKITRHGRL